MIKEGSKIKVHIYDCMNREISTRNIGKVFEVKKQSGHLGINWNTEQSPYICEGNVFNAFYTFASNVIFEDIETREKYHYSNITKCIVENTTE